MLEKMAVTDTLMGDFNCCGGSKKQTLEEVIQDEELQDIGKE